MIQTIIKAVAILIFLFVFTVISIIAIGLLEAVIENPMSLLTGGIG